MKTTTKSRVRLRTDFTSLDAYGAVPTPPPGQGVRLKLDANESQYGASPAAIRALRAYRTSAAYPDPGYAELRRELARYTEWVPEGIVPGAGADEVLDLILRLILDPGDPVVNCPPTFGMYSTLIRLNRGSVRDIPRNQDGTVDTQAVISALDSGAKAVILCTPNNPTGTALPPSDLIRILETGKPVIVDEAYIEFGGISAVPLIAGYPNLIVVRTMSKWAGLAGLRLGYAVADPGFAGALNTVRSPYNVNGAAVVAALAVLGTRSEAEKPLRAIVRERTRMTKALAGVPMFSSQPSEGNFLFLKYRGDLAELRSYLESRAIAVRYFDGPYTGPAIRITIGRPKQNRTVLAALRAFRPTKIRCDAVIFDIDGVLVDVSRSYREVIRLTVTRILNVRYPGSRTPGRADVDAIKRIPGFNNDWDAAYELVRLISSGIPAERFARNARRVTPSVRNGRMYRTMKDTFQTYYLGSTAFEKTYGRPAPWPKDPGLINAETRLVSTGMLLRLKDRFPLGAATSRPRAEAVYALTRLGIMPEFIKPEALVAQEDVPREKPFPDPLIAARKLLGAGNPVYVGDSPSDVMAAASSGMPCVSVGKTDFGIPRIDRTDDLTEVLA